jgi:hypothetical protein
MAMAQLDALTSHEPGSIEREALVVSELGPTLARLERYEKRALSGRKFAIRRFDDALHDSYYRPTLVMREKCFWQNEATLAGRCRPGETYPCFGKTNPK